MFPIMVDLQKYKVVVAGGGKAALQKIKSLLRFDIHVHVLSPEFHDGIRQLADQDKVTLHQKEVAYEDYQDAFLVVAVTNSTSVNEYISKTAKHLVVNAEKPELGNSILPASVNRGKLVLSVSTGGASPMLAKQLRNQLEEQFDDSYEAYLDFLYESRMVVKDSGLQEEAKKKLLREAIQPVFLESIQQREKFLDKLKREIRPTSWNRNMP
ncbi:bifunctional precorrin-2 dehydrogenase/sirohydrochlorin ferrochelatase [Pseudalkalibacillus sp. A8]|uniref:precorrin-2 dehydrogenase/sirohydrochlorin ferrochelatase family protein n=1 Tax=Pseudalkalibacillus sp. A8 TaxID=3382641 RepID=UPI0038B4C5F3